jgi:predicted aminopeptidase
MVRMLTEDSAGSAPCRPHSSPWRAALLAIVCALTAGCGTTYVMQAASGQWHLMHERVPIENVLADPQTPEALRAQLAQVQAARDFASQQLGLPDNKSYRSYADIGRPYVVWNVIAAPEFSVTPHHWCFPVAGCVAYRGYFHEDSARKFAAETAARGFDVTVAGVPAYSTLGKFADPVLSSMLHYGDDELAATIFHELAHQVLYVKDDSSFNEAFATTVENAGLERWLLHQSGGMRLREYRDEQAREAALVKLFAAARTHLAQVYAAPLPAAAMRERKVQVLAVLAAQIHEFEHREGVSYPLYDGWIAHGLNNAQLASVATYYDCVPGFERLLAASDNDLTRFYAAARELSHLSRTERHAQLCGPDSAAVAAGD